MYRFWIENSRTSIVFNGTVAKSTDLIEKHTHTETYKNLPSRTYSVQRLWIKNSSFQRYCPQNGRFDKETAQVLSADPFNTQSCRRPRQLEMARPEENIAKHRLGPRRYVNKQFDRSRIFNSPPRHSVHSTTHL